MPQTQEIIHIVPLISTVDRDQSQESAEMVDLIDTIPLAPTMQRIIGKKEEPDNDGMIEYLFQQGVILDAKEVLEADPELGEKVEKAQTHFANLLLSALIEKDPDALEILELIQMAVVDKMNELKIEIEKLSQQPHSTEMQQADTQAPDNPLGTVEESVETPQTTQEKQGQEDIDPEKLSFLLEQQLGIPEENDSTELQKLLYRLKELENDAWWAFYSY